MVVGIQELPPAILQRIFRSLDAVSLMNCFDVNRQFRACVEILLPHFKNNDFFPSWRRADVAHECSYGFQAPPEMVQFQMMAHNFDLMSRTVPKKVRIFSARTSAALLSGNLLLLASKKGIIRALNVLTLSDFRTDLEDFRFPFPVVSLYSLNLGGKPCYQVLSEDVHAKHDAVVLRGTQGEMGTLFMGQLDQPLPLRLTSFEIVRDWSPWNGIHKGASFTNGVLDIMTHGFYVVVKKPELETKGVASRQFELHCLTRLPPTFGLTHFPVDSEKITDPSLELSVAVYQYGITDHPKVLRPGLSVIVTGDTVMLVGACRVRGSSKYDLTVSKIPLFKLDGAIVGRDAVAAAGSVLFLGTEQGSLYLFRLDELGRPFEPKFLARHNVSSDGCAITHVVAGGVGSDIVCVACSLKDVTLLRWNFDDYFNAEGSQC